MEKLKKNGEFRRLYSKGKSFVTPYFVLYAINTKRNKIRIGITAGKKIGGAVQRNRAKRVIMAAFRQVLPNVSRGTDFVIVARSRILGVKSTIVERLLKEKLIEAQLWSREDAE